MNKIDKFRGKLEISIDGDAYILNSLKVNDLFDFLLLHKLEEQFEAGIKLFTRIFSKSYPSDSELDIEQFCISNYNNIVEELMIALGWTTRDKIDKIKKENRSKENNKNTIAKFKAKLNAEAEKEEIEDKYITTCYILMREFKYTKEYILSMDATTFLILIDEMNKQAKKEKEEMDSKNKTIRRR